MATAIPAGWIACIATVRFTDGTVRAQHTFYLPAGSTNEQLIYRAWQIWSPARAGSDGRFVDPTLTVEAAGLAVAA